MAPDQRAGGRVEFVDVAGPVGHVEAARLGGRRRRHVAMGREAPFDRELADVGGRKLAGARRAVQAVRVGDIGAGKAPGSLRQGGCGHAQRRCQGHDGGSRDPLPSRSLPGRSLPGRSLLSRSLPGRPSPCAHTVAPNVRLSLNERYTSQAGTQWQIEGVMISRIGDDLPAAPGAHIRRTRLAHTSGARLRREHSCGPLTAARWGGTMLHRLDGGHAEGQAAAVGRCRADDQSVDAAVPSGRPSDRAAGRHPRHVASDGRQLGRIDALAVLLTHVRPERALTDDEDRSLRALRRMLDDIADAGRHRRRQATHAAGRAGLTPPIT